MPSYQLIVSDGKNASVDIEAANQDEAVNDGINALALFAFQNFPPPDNVSVAINDDANNKIATVSFSFQIIWENARPH